MSKHLCVGLKTFYWISYLGLTLCIGGEIIRKLAMMTAKSNFNHVVCTYQERENGFSFIKFF